MEIIFRNIPLVRSGYSGRRGELSVNTILLIPTHSYSRVVTVYYKNIIVGRVEKLTIVDMRNGIAELRGDIIFDCSYATVAKLAFKELYPVVSISTTLNNKAIPDPCLAGVLLSHRDAREFEDQQPLDLSELRELMKGMEKSEAPGSFLFTRRYDDVNCGFLGTLMLDRCNKILFNESDTLETEKGYLIVNTKNTVSAVKISEIEVIESIKNKDKTETVFMRTASGTCAEMRNSNISIRDLIEILERYKESQLVALKAS
ncbi:hypothetical protein I9E57_000917 [Salmonella enterica]|nr:hypothetical protein [Salmonella enterica]